MEIVRRFGSQNARPSEDTLKTLARLNEIKCIDKRQVIWWQLGFEGRRIITEREFESRLITITYQCNGNTASDFEFRERSFKVWPDDYVPIMLKRVKLNDEIEANCFFSIKPLTHHWPGTNLTHAIAKQRATQLPVEINMQPHIRGIEICNNERFLFWHPILMGTRPGRYDSLQFRIKSGEVILILPIHPDHFYANLVKNGWPKGRRLQKKSTYLDLTGIGVKVVPFYEFDYKQNNVTIYPATIWNDGRQMLDVPVIITGGQGADKPGILGCGLIHLGNNCLDPGNTSESTKYWPLENSQKKIAVRSLIERLGGIRRS